MFVPCLFLQSDSLHSLSLCPGFQLLVTHCHLDRTIQERGEAFMGHSGESKTLCQGSQGKQEPPDSMVLVGAPRLTAVALAPSDHHDHLSQPPTSHTCCVRLHLPGLVLHNSCALCNNSFTWTKICTIVHLPFHVTLFKQFVIESLS